MQHSIFAASYSYFSHYLAWLTCNAAGYKPKRQDLLYAVGQTVTIFDHTPESRLPINHGETTQQAKARRQAQYLSIKNGLVTVIVNHLMGQPWPTANVAVPENSNTT